MFTGHHFIVFSILNFLFDFVNCMMSQHILRIEKVKMSEKVKVCEFCEEQPAVVLCAECWKCYCNECNKYTHGKASKKDHKIEVIPKGVRVDAMCPLHKGNQLELFCVDDVELCCANV